MPFGSRTGRNSHLPNYQLCRFCLETLFSAVGSLVEVCSLPWAQGGHPAAAVGSMGCTRSRQSQEVQGQTQWPVGGGQRLGAGLGANLCFLGVIFVGR